MQARSGASPPLVTSPNFRFPKPTRYLLPSQTAPMATSGSVRAAGTRSGASLPVALSLSIQFQLHPAIPSASHLDPMVTSGLLRPLAIRLVASLLLDGYFVVS